MKLKTVILFILVITITTSCGTGNTNTNTQHFSLKESFGDKFLVGVALNKRQAAEQDTAAVRIIKQHFNSIVAENCMKSEIIHPEEGRYNFGPADTLVSFGERNGMAIIGHCLIWHSQLAPWFCVDAEGKKVSPEVLKQRMKEHISTIVGRYRGRVKGWDVVNEAIIEDGSYRQTPFYEILGEEYISLAFQYAHEADPDAELYYNDYGMNIPGRREGVIRMVKKLKERGLRIDAIGMQGHMGMDYPNIRDFEQSILAFASTGCRVMITEWEMSALPTVHQAANISDKVAYNRQMNPYPDALPDSVNRIWNRRMLDFFHLFLKHSDIIDRVTVWGVSDGDSWKNDFPMKGRKEYPLLFDRNYQPKPFVRELLSPKKAIFHNFTYSAEGSFSDTTDINPILPGCYPDPSICRVDSDYYLVNSSFAFFPGIPIWHSIDLRHWTQLGYVLNRPSQLPLADGLRIDGGIYAPDIKYNPHNRLFYLITTDVDGRGNFFVTTPDPKSGHWSDPVFLPEVGGIDPSFLFDKDGKAYILNNDAPQGKPLYDGHRAIWIREFDWQTGCTVGHQQMLINGGINISKKPVWIEGPHLYHIGNTYYLMAAEGGTSINHCEVIFSATTPFGPFTPCKINPILTQRDLPADRPAPVTCAGHADLVQTPEGDWKAVFLAVRPYKDGHDVMGRETFLLPVQWKDNQPIILPQGESITYTDRHVPATPLWTADGLGKEAFFVRTPQTNNFQINKQGELSLAARTIRIDEWKQPSAIGRWITNETFRAQTVLSFCPETENDFAGLVLFQNDACNVRFGKTIVNREICLKLEAYSQGKCHAEAMLHLPEKEISQTLYLQVQGKKERDGVFYTFAYTIHPNKEWTTIGQPVSADLLSTQTAGGFTGTMVGIYATADYVTNSQK